MMNFVFKTRKFEFMMMKAVMSPGEKVRLMPFCTGFFLCFMLFFVLLFDF